MRISFSIRASSALLSAETDGFQGLREPALQGGVLDPARSRPGSCPRRCVDPLARRASEDPARKAPADAFRRNQTASIACPLLRRQPEWRKAQIATIARARWHSRPRSEAVFKATASLARKLASCRYEQWSQGLAYNCAFPGLQAPDGGASRKERVRLHGGQNVKR